MLFSENTVNKRTLSTSCNSCNANQNSFRYLNSDSFKVVKGGVFDLPRLCPFSPMYRFSLLLFSQSCDSFGARIDILFDRTVEANFPPKTTRPWPYLDNMICGGNKGFIVLHDKDGVPIGDKTPENGDQLFNIPRVKTYSGFIKDIHQTGKVAVKLPGHLYSLALPSGEG